MAERTVSCIAEIPFEQRAPRELFDVREDRKPGRDYFGFGWCVLPLLELHDNEGVRALRTLRDALVLLTHAFDEQPEQGDEIDLGFWFDEDEWYEEDDDEDHDFVIVTPLTAFVRVHLPKILASLEQPPASVVLSVCNPRRVAWTPPAEIGGQPLWFPSGVAHWRWSPSASLSQGFQLCLSAPRWTPLGAAQLT